MRIARLFRFPVKGLPAEEIPAANAADHGGLTGDRMVAFSNGSTEVTEHQWQPCSTFTVLKNNTDLQKWSVSSHPPQITVTAPNADPLSFDSSTDTGRSSATDYFSAHLPAQGPQLRKIVSAGHGMFDSRLSGISLINPRTVDALSQASGTQLDPLRYRGNILLEGLDAFEEFSLIGKVLRIGDVRLAITKSIERCPATSVNPSSTDVDINGPRLLATHFGHLHCGIYGTVLVPGLIQAGDEIHVEESDRRALTMVPTKRTPRFLEVVQRRIVDEQSVQLTLNDPQGWITEYEEPGTHLRVHLQPSLWRNYTITKVSGTQVTIAVRQQGEASRMMGQLGVGDRLLASGPHGTMTAKKVLHGKTALLTAGIGITASLGLLRGAQQAEQLSALGLVHVERRTEGELFSSLRACANSLEVPVSVVHYDSSQTRPSFRDFTQAVTGYDSVMACGPAAFIDLVVKASQAAGLKPEQIHRETFASPLQDTSSLLARHSPAQVHCTLSALEFTWHPNDGMLLEALESQGLKPQSSCRAGSCGNCALQLLSGSVSYAIEPSARVDEQEILTCLAIPQQDLQLKI